MWRRVASQSPTTAPVGVMETEETGSYLHAWDALGKMLASGRSLSGRERNCCFLNTGSTRFANISAVSGFDFPDDTRGVAITDWDHDGDLDVWMTNRTAPRIRLLQNHLAAGQNAVLLKLEGTQSNRDAIGALVGLDLGSAGRLVRALRAGEGYLSQSSKWLHFGLGAASEVKRVIVRWPNGQREAFRGVAANGRYTLIEGSGQAVRQALRKTSLPSPLAESDPEPSSTQRLVLPARIPMPDLSYRDLEGNDVALTGSVSKPLLINLWASWCEPCLAELAEWSRHEAEFSAAGVEVILLSVDEATAGKPLDSATIRQLLEQLEIPFSAGLATPELLDTLDVTQQVLTKRIRPMPVPTSFLVDGQGRLSAVYKGQANVEQVLTDIFHLDAPVEKHRDWAVAFPGTWYTNPFPPDLLAIPKKYQQLGQPERALQYLARYASESVNARTAVPHDVASAEGLAKAYVELAKLLQEQGKQDLVIESLQAAARLQPDDARPRLALAMIFQQSGRPADAASQYREVLKYKPGDPVTSNNLAWLLATCADPDVRRPGDAIRLAEEVTKKSRRKLPSALDTLAAAYAAAGQFNHAVATIQEAITLQRSMGQDAGAMQGRLQLYQQKEAFTDTAE